MLVSDPEIAEQQINKKITNEDEDENTRLQFYNEKEVTTTQEHHTLIENPELDQVSANQIEDESLTDYKLGKAEESVKEDPATQPPQPWSTNLEVATEMSRETRMLHRIIAPPPPFHLPRAKLPRPPELQVQRSLPKRCQWWRDEEQNLVMEEDAATAWQKTPIMAVLLYGLDQSHRLEGRKLLPFMFQRQGDVPKREQVQTPAFPGTVMEVAEMTRQIKADDGACDGEAPPTRDGEAPPVRSGEAPQVHCDQGGPWSCGGTFVAGRLATMVVLPWVHKRRFWNGDGVDAALGLNVQEMVYTFLGLTHFCKKPCISMKEINFLGFTNQGQPDSICGDNQGYWFMA